MRPTRASRLTAEDEPSGTVGFGHLFGRHARAVYTFCARRTADLSLAEDLTSITFLEAWRHRHRMPLAEDGSALPWLLGVANNVVRNARRGQRRYSAALKRLHAPSTMPAAEDHVVARSTTEAGLREALTAISELSEGEQEVVMLVLWSELSYKDAATALGVSLGTVQSRLSRARSKLQASLSNVAYSIPKESS